METTFNNYTYSKDVKKEIEFDDDDMLEEFFENMVIESDEQDCETQDKATCNIEKLSWGILPTVIQIMMIYKF